MNLGNSLGISRLSPALGPPAFNPASVLFASAEKGFWWDPSDLSTLFQDDEGTIPVTAAGQPVGRMNDKSGNGRPALQSNAAARPIYQTNGTLHWLEFGTDKWMVTFNIAPGTDKAQVFAGFEKTDNVAGVLLEHGTSTGLNGTFAVLPGGSTGDASRRTITTELNGSQRTIASPNAGSYSGPTTNVIAYSYDIAEAARADEFSLRINGADAATVDYADFADAGTGDFQTRQAYLGARNGSSLFFNGKLYSAICRFGSNLDLATIQDVEGYVAVKTGVTL